MFWIGLIVGGILSLYFTWLFGVLRKDFIASVDSSEFLSARDVLDKHKARREGKFVGKYVPASERITSRF
jgi:hypothetical protein